MKEKQTERLTIRIRPSTKSRLKLIAESLDISVSKLIDRITLGVKHERY